MGLQKRSEEGGLSMEVGDIVTIYEDPLSCQKPEGEAKLVELLIDDKEMQYWKVESLGEYYRRWIKKVK